MLSRRTLLSLVAGSMAAPRLASAQQASQKVALYANVGPDLTHYDVDVAGAELIKRETVTLPAAVQYAWPHASRRYLYIASSNSAPAAMVQIISRVRRRVVFRAYGAVAHRRRAALSTINYPPPRQAE